MALPPQYARFKKTHPELVAAYEALGEACRAAGPLDARTAALVKLGIALGAGLEGATHSAVRKGLDAGCTADEMLHVATLATTTLGFPAMMRARSWVLDVVDKK
ncbi:MAG: carboxymuconolactone decarboxylase family protein [Planctomycetes bacterium]|nr:carboxymuconolactone decarboxylase family protein [Planctomycetota bacterium]